MKKSTATEDNLLDSLKKKRDQEEKKALELLGRLAAYDENNRPVINIGKQKYLSVTPLQLVSAARIRRKMKSKNKIIPFNEYIANKEIEMTKPGSTESTQEIKMIKSISDTLLTISRLSERIEKIENNKEKVNTQLDTQEGYRLKKFKIVSEALSPAKKLEIDTELKKYQDLKKLMKNGENQDNQILEIENKMDATLSKMHALLEYEMKYRTKTYSSDPAHFVQNFKNICSSIVEFITITGDKALKREYERVRKEFDALQKTGDFSEKEEKMLTQKLLNLLPTIYHSATNFMINLKASYQQVEGYDNIISRASKHIRKPKSP
jgi:hypothetical protein